MCLCLCLENYCAVLTARSLLPAACCVLCVCAVCAVCAVPRLPAAPAPRACRALPLTALAKQGARCAQMPPRRRYQPGGGGATCASTKARIMLRRLRFGMTVLLSSMAPVVGEVSLVRSHSEMAVRS